jgi:uncharacterized protein YbjT (DUF2867 family)
MLKRVLVIGATGNVGSQVVRRLLERGAEVTALTRRPGAAELPEGVGMLHGDLTDPACLDGGTGVDAAFLVWTAPLATAPAVIETLAKRAGRIVFLSNMTVSDGVERYDNRESTVHHTIEQLISRGPCGWTFLRPGVFANNARLWWGPQIRSGDVVRWPYGEASTAPIHEADLAAVAVRALLDDGHDRGKHVLTGPEALSHRDQVRIIGEALGRPLRFEEMTPEEARAAWSGTWPAPVIDMLLAAWPRLIGTPVLVTPTVREVTGAEPRRFQDWVKDHAGAFQKGAF